MTGATKSPRAAGQLPGRPPRALPRPGLLSPPCHALLPPIRRRCPPPRQRRPPPTSSTAPPPASPACPAATVSRLTGARHVPSTTRPAASIPQPPPDLGASGASSIYGRPHVAPPPSPADGGNLRSRAPATLPASVPCSSMPSCASRRGSLPARLRMLVARAPRASGFLSRPEPPHPSSTHASSGGSTRLPIAGKRAASGPHPDAPPAVESTRATEGVLCRPLRQFTYAVGRVQFDLLWCSHRKSECGRPPCTAPGVHKHCRGSLHEAVMNFSSMFF